MRSLRAKFCLRCGTQGRSLVVSEQRRGKKRDQKLWGKDQITKCLPLPACKVKYIYNSLCFVFRPQTFAVSSFSPLGPFPLRWSSANFYLQALPTLPACQCGAREVFSEEAKQANMMKAFLCSSSRPSSHAGACTAADEESLGGARSSEPGCSQDATWKGKC